MQSPPPPPPLASQLSLEFSLISTLLIKKKKTSVGLPQLDLPIIRPMLADLFLPSDLCCHTKLLTSTIPHDDDLQQI